MNFLLPFFEVADWLLHAYTWVIIAAAVMSWLIAFGVVDTRNQFVASVGRFLYGVTEPALRPIRRLLPSLSGIDLSPIVLLLAIYLARRLLWELFFALASATM